MTDVGSHIVLGYGLCVIGCVNASFQDGHFSFSFGGVGAIEKGPYIGWANLTPCNRESTSATAGGGYGGGGIASVGVNLSQHQVNPNDWEVDVGQIGGVQFGMMKTITTGC
jgi:hypothetical protein